MDIISPVRFEDGKPMLLGGLRRHHAYAEAGAGLAAQWEQFKSGGEMPGRIGSNSYGVMCGHDAAGFEYMCAVEVESFAGLPQGMGRMRVPAQRYAVFAHHGPAVTLKSTWQKVFAWLEGGSYESAHRPDFEVYGPDAGLATGDTGIEIWVGVVPQGKHLRMERSRL